MNSTFSGVPAPVQRVHPELGLIKTLVLSELRLLKLKESSRCKQGSTCSPEKTRQNYSLT